MTKKRQFDSVSEMVHAIADDTGFAESLDSHLAARAILTEMMALRAARDFSQKDIAESLGCSQSKLSKLENGTDDELHLGDLRRYAEALGMQLRVVLSEKKETIVDEVKYHAFRIKELMDQLADLAKDDSRIAQGVAWFVGEACFNLVRMLQDSAQKLPEHPGVQRPHIEIEVRKRALEQSRTDSSESTDDDCELCVAR